MDRVLVKILGYGVDTFNFKDALEYAFTHSGQVVTINPEMIQYAQNNPEFADIISNAELVIPDGVGVECGLKLLGHNVKRIPGVDFGKSLIVKFSNEGKSVAMVGAKLEIIELAAKNLKNEIPNLNLIYQKDGYFENNEVVYSELEQLSPDLVLVALGSPKQEFFINGLKTRLPKALMIGLGGSFDVWSGNVTRAPKFIQKIGLEWFYRTFKEPKRIKRIFPTLPLFVLKVCKERFSN